MAKEILTIHVGNVSIHLKILRDKRNISFCSLTYEDLTLVENPERIFLVAGSWHVPEQDPIGSHRGSYRIVQKFLHYIIESQQ